jgi:hypothetical protein
VFERRFQLTNLHLNGVSPRCPEEVNIFTLAGEADSVLGGPCRITSPQWVDFAKKHAHILLVTKFCRLSRVLDVGSVNAGVGRGCLDNPLAL